MFAVFHCARPFDSDRFSTPILMKGTTTGIYSEAVEFAEILASEHADAIYADRRVPFGIRYAATTSGSSGVNGFTLRTSNGTHVFYTVKRLTDGNHS